MDKFFEDIGYIFLIGWSDPKLARSPARNLEVLRDIPTIGGLPEFTRGEYCHQHLMISCPIHLLSDDIFDVTEYSVSYREEFVGSSHALADISSLEEYGCRDVITHFWSCFECFEWKSREF